MTQPNWHEIVFDANWLLRLDALASRRFVDSVAAEEATTYVIEQLSANEWARCRRYTGTASPTTYLHSLAANLIEEFSRKRYGRPRPPAWLVRQGEMWVALWQRICLERDLVPQVVDRLCSSGEYSKTSILGIIRCIKARLPWCGSSTLPVPIEYIDDNGSPWDITDALLASDNLEENIRREDTEDTLAIIAALLHGDDEISLGFSTQQLEKLQHDLQLDSEDILMLRMHYRDGLSFSAIARAMCVPNHRPARQIRKILAAIQESLEQFGITLDGAIKTLDTDRQVQS